MKRFILCTTGLLLLLAAMAQTEPSARNWKPWFISSVKSYRLDPPSTFKNEVTQVLEAQNSLDSAGKAQIIFWSSGAPGYRWQDMMNKLWMTDISNKGVLANMLLGTAIYDATLAAWDSKYAFNRPRPFAADSRIKVFGNKPTSPSYPCEYSVTAGVAATIISHFFPTLADSVQRLAREVMASRVAAGTAFPSDTKAGFELGKKIALAEIEHTKEYPTSATWDGKVPTGEKLWNGKKPMLPMAGLNKTVVLDSASQFRPPAPPDFAKEMEDLKNYKQNFRSQANAFYWASQDYWQDILKIKIFEQNLHLNPPRAARIYATAAVATYDAFTACFDAKYAYWGIRPDQYDTTYRSLVPTPPFPGYPSGHALMSGLYSDLYSYFFPADKAMFQKKAKEAAESRFQAGIHFRSDNEVGLELGRKVSELVVQRIKSDGADPVSAGQKTARLQ